MVKHWGGKKKPKPKIIRDKSPVRLRQRDTTCSLRHQRDKDAFIPDRHPPASSLHAMFTFRSFGATVQKNGNAVKKQNLSRTEALRSRQTLRWVVSHALFNLRIDSEKSKFDYLQTSYPLPAVFCFFCLRSFRFPDPWEYYKTYMLLF